MVEKGNGTGEIFSCTVAKLAMTRRVASNLRGRMEAQNGHTSNIKGNADRRNYESQDVFFTPTLKNKILSDGNWICDIGACGNYCMSNKDLFDVKDIN
jgi:hypothetical protein